VSRSIRGSISAFRRDPWLSRWPWHGPARWAFLDERADALLGLLGGPDHGADGRGPAQVRRPAHRLIQETLGRRNGRRGAFHQALANSDRLVQAAVRGGD